MSKLYQTYLSLKAKEEEPAKTLFLFKSGIFFIFLDADAKIVSSMLGLKLTNLTESILKCGFPSNALEKYKVLLGQTPYTLKIVDTSKNEYYTPQSYSISEDANELLQELAKIDVNNTSVRKAYEFIESMKFKAEKILKNGGNY